jgi:hypothetical protein
MLNFRRKATTINQLNINMMNRNFTRLASVLMCVAFGCLPLAGQEKAGMKTGTGEYVPKQSVELRAEELPDSAIIYSPNGGRKTRYVYHSNSNSGTYAWENNAWKFTSFPAQRATTG